MGYLGTRRNVLCTGIFRKCWLHRDFFRFSWYEYLRKGKTRIHFATFSPFCSAHEQAILLDEAPRMERAEGGGRFITFCREHGGLAKSDVINVAHVYIQ